LKEKESSDSDANNLQEDEKAYILGLKYKLKSGFEDMISTIHLYSEVLTKSGDDFVL